MLALEKKYKSKMDFIVAEVTSPEGTSLADKFDIYYIPVYFILDSQGKLLDRIEFSEIQKNPGPMLDSRISAGLQKIR